MKQKLLTIILLSIVRWGYTQANIDVNTDIQMGVAGTEHVKITNTNFSVHQDAANPLIYGDFTTGNVGIGANNPASQLEVHGSVLPSIAIGSPNAETGGQSRLLFHAGSGIYKNGFSINYYKDASADRLGFVAGGVTEVLSLTNGGNIGVGTSSPLTTLSVHGPITVTDDPAYGPVRLMSWGLYNPSNSVYIEPAPGNTLYLVPTDWSQNMTTVVYGTMNVHGSLNQVSDERLKKNIRSVSNASDKLKQIRGVAFEWQESDRSDVGLLAQEVEAVFPELVQEVEVRQNDDGGTTETFKSVNYSGLIAPMIESIKELQQQLETQAQEITQLRQQLNQLENRN